MELIRGLHNLNGNHRGCVATIGNFDGVHLGHQAVFDALRRESAEKALPSVVIIFEPQPAEFFDLDHAPARLTRLREKLEIIAAQDIDRVLLLKFNRLLANLDAEKFIQEILVDRLGVAHLYVGDDFQFGNKRRGDFNLLMAAGNEHGFEVTSMNTIADNSARYSSTRIRLALLEGDLEDAASCLGRPYHICGRVGHGDKRGRQMAFPTININLHRRVPPLRGVYAVRVYGLTVNPWPGVANLGNRPTVDSDQRYLLEVHLLDFDREVYGRQVRVEFVERIRSEKKFDSLDHLIRRIEMDADQAREIFGLNRTEPLSFEPSSQLT